MKDVVKATPYPTVNTTGYLDYFFLSRTRESETMPSPVGSGMGIETG